MSKIEMMEVNQHTSDEVAKVLADLAAQGVDLAAIKAAMEKGGSAEGAHGVQEFTSSGTFVVPEGVQKIWVTAAAGGGGGGGGHSSMNTGGGGGGGGACIKGQPFAVVPGESISITIGAAGSAGAAGANGGKGGSTVIGSLVTLAGGGGGGQCTSSDKNGGKGGDGTGTSGGGGGGSSTGNSQSGAQGGDGYEPGYGGYPSLANDYGGQQDLRVLGKGGISPFAKGGVCGYASYSGGSAGQSNYSGGGGGGSLGIGGNGAYHRSSSVYKAATAGTKGGGGGGGAGGSGGMTACYKGAAGGKGYCLIEW